MLWGALVLLCLLPGVAGATTCTLPAHWIGINASGGLDLCGDDGLIHSFAWGTTTGGPYSTPVPTMAPATPQPTYAYTAPTAQPTYAYTAPTPQPTYAYTAPTPVPTVAQLSAVYDPASLAANTSRCDAVTVTGVVTGKAIMATPGVSPATGCVIAGAWPSATNVVTVCWRNVFAASTACDTASSTWVFKQP